ncbi:MAG: hypothetical protein AB4426_12595 [Xenococcaceae cyanobacterium]
MTKLDFAQRESGVHWCFVPLNWSGKFEINQQPQPNTWVRLLEFLNPLCYNEALLLCQESESEWVVWIPDHGEAILHTSQFCLNPPHTSDRAAYSRTMN